MRKDDFYEDDDLENEDDDFEKENSPFLQGKAFMIPLSPQLRQQLNIKPEFQYNQYGFCSGEWILRVLHNNYDGASVTETGIIMMEAFPNKNFKGEREYDILDAYQYLKLTHYLRMIIAYEFDIPSYWSVESENINISIQDTDIKSSVISIMITLMGSPEHLNFLVEDSYRQSKSNVKHIQDKIPMTCSVTKIKSLYAPVTTLNINLGLVTNNSINFSNISIDALYSNFIEPELIEVLNDYYPFNLESYILPKYLKLSCLNAQYEINYNNYSMNIIIRLSPAYILSEDCLYRFEFTGLNSYAINYTHSEFLPEKYDTSVWLNSAVMNFVSNACTSPYIQHFIQTTLYQTRLSLYDSNEWENYIFSEIIATNNMIIHNSNYELVDPSQEIKIDSDHKLYVNLESRIIDNIEIIPFINISFKIDNAIIRIEAMIGFYHKDYSNISDVVDRVANLPSYNQILTKKAINMLKENNFYILYSDNEYTRIAIINFKDNVDKEKNPPSNKKRGGLFGL